MLHKLVEFEFNINTMDALIWRSAFMFVDYTGTQRALRREFRAYFSQLIKPEYRNELRDAESGELYKQLIRQQGKDGHNPQRKGYMGTHRPSLPSTDGI